MDREVCGLTVMAVGPSLLTLVPVLLIDVIRAVLGVTTAVLW